MLFVCTDIKKFHTFAEKFKQMYDTKQVLDLSKNAIGPLGGSHLIQKLPQIRMLRTLKLAGC